MLSPQALLLQQLTTNNAPDLTRTSGYVSSLTNFDSGIFLDRIFSEDKLEEYSLMYSLCSSSIKSDINPSFFEGSDCSGSVPSFNGVIVDLKERDDLESSCLGFE